MLPISLFVAFLVPLLASLLTVPFLKKLALRKGWVDEPDGGRKRHAGPIPNIGGVAIAASVGLGLTTLFWMGDILSFELTFSKMIVILGAVLVLLTGFYDDIRDLGFKKKFLVQILLAYLLLHAGYRIEISNLLFDVDDPYQQALYSIPITMIWIVGILNAVNLMDGLDGLAAGVSVIVFAALAVLFGQQADLHLVALSLIMIGALIGFLVFNFSPASIFMGDTGSLFLGFVLASCTLALEDGTYENPIMAILVPVMPLGLPIIDTGLSIVRRLIAGRSPFAPDRNHIHHRLARIFPQRTAVLMLYAVALWFGIVAIFMTFVTPLLGFLVVALNMILVYLGLRWLGRLEIAGTVYDVIPAPSAKHAQPRQDHTAGAMRQTDELHEYHTG